MSALTFTVGVPVPAIPAEAPGTPVLDALMWIAVALAIVSVIYFAGYRAFVEWPRRRQRDLPDWTAILWLVSAPVLIIAVLAAWGTDSWRTTQARDQNDARHEAMQRVYADLWDAIENEYGVRIADLSSWIVEDPLGTRDTVVAVFPDGHEEECVLTRESAEGQDVLTLTCPTDLPLP